MISLADEAVVRNIAQTRIPRLLTDHYGLRVVFVCRPEKQVEYKKRLAGKNVAVESIAVPPPSMREKIVTFLAMNCFLSKTLYLMQWRAYLLGQSRVHPYIKRSMALIFGNNKFFRLFIRYTDSFLKGATDCERVFDTYNPSVVLSTMLLDRSIDLPLLREAKRRGIKTIGMVRSWDNLSTYGFLRFLPDLFIAQNEYIRTTAIARHDVCETTIKVTGLPHYDAHISREMIVSREVFCKTLGIDPQKKIIMYAAVGDSLFHDEGALMPIFENFAQSNVLGTPVNFIFRAHPAHHNAPPGTLMKHVYFDSGAPPLHSGDNGIRMDARHTAHLINSLFHSDVVVSASGTSMLIDAATFEKPLVAIAFESAKPRSGWLSVARFSDHADHSLSLLECGGIAVVNSKKELVAALFEYLKHNTLHQDGRRKMIERFASPLDGKSSERLAALVAAQALIY